MINKMRNRSFFCLFFLVPYIMTLGNLLAVFMTNQKGDSQL